MSPTNPKRNRLREHREAAGLTQQDLADAVGAGRTTIIRAEQGTQSPTLELADRIADELCTTIDELFGDPDRETLDGAYYRGRRDERDDLERARRLAADTPGGEPDRGRRDEHEDLEPDRRVADDVPGLVRTLGKRIADPDSLLLLRELDAAIAEAWATAIAGLRETGYSDRRIGAELGVTKQSVQKRWPRKETR
jgi:putative transcriptional regulator